MLKILNKRMNSKGFTLIELLVVIAIIGILSSVVMVSLNSARNKAKDSAIKSNLSEIRSRAEMCYDDATPHSYDGCSIGESIESVKNNGGTVTGSLNATQDQIELAAGSDTYCIISTLASNSSEYWCVDSNGTSQKVTSNSCITDTNGNELCP